MPAQPQTVSFKDNPYYGKYTQYLSGQAVELNAQSKVTLKPGSRRFSSNEIGLRIPPYRLVLAVIVPRKKFESHEKPHHRNDVVDHL